ncbi:Reverse transcriptase-rnase h-integrase [Phytophthora megakarya]|uniref:Reverse transcriptase-rnase h-integrase n=1 Tax=Phytophthora megakarya TaxID=4795 RepID=A0A225W3D6_9STRA|nr:Reverse transcriptase-rnase h-integrase [Phytophthora megakarya]
MCDITVCRRILFQIETRNLRQSSGLDVQRSSVLSSISHLRATSGPKASGLQDDWDRYLALAEFAYNNRYQFSIEMSSFLADLGHVPKIPTDLILPSGSQEPAVKFVTRMDNILRSVQAQLRSSAEK